MALGPVCKNEIFPKVTIVRFKEEFPMGPSLKAAGLFRNINGHYVATNQNGGIILRNRKVTYTSSAPF